MMNYHVDIFLACSNYEKKSDIDKLVMTNQSLTSG